MTEEKFVPGYHDLVRPEILARVPQTAAKILDIGCGTGATGAALKKRQPCIVNGVESNPGAVKEADKNLDNVYQHDLDLPRPQKYGAIYNCIIFADILEHLKNPWGVFHSETQTLKIGGTAIISIPNVAHPSIIRELTLGLFRYKDAGILDITHVRFFTKTTFSQFLTTMGFLIRDITPHPSKENPIQFIFTAEKKKSQEAAPVVTLIMPTYNTKDLTEKAINSVFQNTTTRFKLIVIDNNSNDGTVEMLRKDKRVFHIENTFNLGFPTAVNIGLECVQTPYFAILNSDIIVTFNWVSHMIETMKADPEIGIVGPRSNYVSGPQLLEGFKYETQEQLQKLAATHMQNCKEPPMELHRIVFFCVLIKTELMRNIGTLDEIFGMGNFEDDDYCLRALRAGYKNVIDNAVFIHHYGSQTFMNSNIEFKNLLQRNMKIFKAKWGIK